MSTPTQIKNGIFEAVSLIQWALTAIGLTLMLALFAGTMLVKFGIGTARFVTAPPLDLMYLAIAWSAVSGLFNVIGTLFKR